MPEWAGCRGILTRSGPICRMWKVDRSGEWPVVARRSDGVLATRTLCLPPSSATFTETQASLEGRAGRHWSLEGGPHHLPG